MNHIDWEAKTEALIKQYREASPGEQREAILREGRLHGLSDGDLAHWGKVKAVGLDEPYKAKDPMATSPIVSPSVAPSQPDYQGDWYG